MKDIRSLLLLLLSFGLVATWAYHIYDKSSYSQQKTEGHTRDSVQIANEVRDSLQKVYTATINNLDLRLASTRSTSDSLHLQLQTKVNEVNRLKTEISSVLKNPRSTNAELDLARQKMNELESIVNEW